LVSPGIHRSFARLHERSRRVPIRKTLREINRAVVRGDARHLADERLGETSGAVRRTGHGEIAGGKSREKINRRKAATARSRDF
jgi:hypothetical protein